MIPGLVIIVLALIGAARVLRVTYLATRRVLARTGRFLATLDATQPDAIAALARTRRARGAK